MKNWGIEFEYFIFDDKNEFVPAFEAGGSTDGNPLIGELRTGVNKSLIDSVFELQKLIYLEEQRLKSKGFRIGSVQEVKLSNELLQRLRSSEKYIDNKQLEFLKEYSVYGKKTGRVLPKNIVKASFQINVSDNATKTIHYTEDKERKEEPFTYSKVFDFYSIIKGLDNLFAEEIRTSKRVPGVFAIKEGSKGNRVEYRSLPNLIDVNKLLEFKYEA